LDHEKLRAIALQSVGRGTQWNAIVIEAGAGAYYCFSIAGRIDNAQPWREVVGISLDRIGQELNVVTESGIESQIRSHSPLILNKHAKVRIRLKLTRSAKRLLVVQVISVQEIIEGAEL
jgi:hypothetical protein